MKLVFAIGIGSFIGGILRYLLSQFIQTKFLSTFPFGTLGVNIIGCFFMGLVFGLSERGNMSQELRLFLATGLIGGFTTFSAFSIETVGLLHDGQVWHALSYIIFSIVVGIIATFFGITIIKLF